VARAGLVGALQVGNDFDYVRQVIGKRIASQRTKQGYSKAELARKAGTSPRVLYYWEEGVREPSVTHLYMLAKALKVSVDTLLPKLA